MATKDFDSISVDRNGDDGSESGLSSASDPILSQRPRRRLATVYDAVAGRVWHDQLRGNDDQDRARSPSELPKAIKHLTRETPYAPEEVLFRRKHAPERYAEHDIYQAHERDLPRGGRGVLPESDLLKAVHGYTSRFYGALERDQRYLDGRNVDERSMDETALLAFGILLEEAGREVLGRRGDMVFTEGVEPSEPDEEFTPNVPGERDSPEATPTARAPKRRKTVKSEASSAIS
ncbi:hypothetical protein HJFPF1_03755 [Paramyrothecium foliicola]|nr:hypothetical protein HJFPF1_03755 [Paramyrothecium foliicola]